MSLATGASLPVNKATLMILAAAPAALFLPAALDAPLDAGLLTVALLLSLWWPRACLQALRSTPFIVLSTLALVALAASDRVSTSAMLYVAEFIAGTFTGTALHYVYIEQWHGRLSRQPLTALLLASYVAALSYGSLVTGHGHTQLATLTLTLAALMVFTLLRVAGRIIYLAFVVPAFLLLNSKALLFALLAGCLVLGNLRATAGRTRFLWLRAAALAGVLTPIALGVLWYANPERFEDLANPTRSISTMARLDMAAAGLEAFRDNPLLGLGGHGMNIDYNFHRYYKEENLAGLIAEGRTRSHADVYGPGFTSGVHNMFLDYLSTYGGISFAVVLVLLARGFIVSVRCGYILKIAAAVTILVLGLAWQYTTSAFGTALLIFACWPFRLGAGLPLRLAGCQSAAGDKAAR